MNESTLKVLLDQVKTGTVQVDDAVKQLKDLPYVELGYATVDTHRHLRMGVPEVVLGGPKTLEQIFGIVGALVDKKQSVLVTRLSEEKGLALKQKYAHGAWHEAARIFEIREGNPVAGKVAVVSAGTADVPVAEEAAVTAAAVGADVRRIYDVGVAGLHRLLRRRHELDDVHAVVVVAGMEGALASVVGGMVSVPVVAVPTSVGYGANFQGLSALLTMLNSCASTVATVNIDNGFGGGLYAALISRTQGLR